MSVALLIARDIGQVGDVLRGVGDGLSDKDVSDRRGRG